MKIFWSWQADTHGKTGRYFVRNVLADAIAFLKEREDIEEPNEREIRDALHLDHDRNGISGSPDLAPTIFKKIDDAAVFIADVTLVVQMTPEDEKKDKPKKLINSNVAIEYGYALHALKDQSILMVQNTYYGDRQELPFDLKHKAGPIQYRLAPDAKKAEIDSEHVKLRNTFIEALKPYLAQGKGGITRKFEEILPTYNIAYFWQRGEVLARIGEPNSTHPSNREEAIEYRFDEQRAFYLRLIPTVPLDAPLKITTLLDIINNRRPALLSNVIINGGRPDRNHFGAILYEAQGFSPVPTAFTQIFQNGEIWAVSKQLIASYQGGVIIPMKNVENIYKRVISNFLVTALDDLKLAEPYQIEIGAIGLEGVRLSLPKPVTMWDSVSEPVRKSEIKIRRQINTVKDETAWQLTEEFLSELYDLAGILVE